MATQRTPRVASSSRSEFRRSLHDASVPTTERADGDPPARESRLRVFDRYQPQQGVFGVTPIEPVTFVPFPPVEGYCQRSSGLLLPPVSASRCVAPGDQTGIVAYCFEAPARTVTTARVP